MPISLPKSVPTGTDHYYLDRLADFQERWPDDAPPSYYAKYGDKCLHQFRQTEPNLTSQGQMWLQTTLVGLQERMELRRASDPAGFGCLERDSDAFEEMAFQMHSQAYLESGISELPLSDLIKIAKTPDASDLLTPRGLREIFEVIAGMETGDEPGVFRQAIRNFVTMLRSRLRRDG